MAGVMVMLAGFFVVVSVWDSVSRLRSIETREAIEKFLAEPPGNELSLSVESVIDVLHVTSMIAAVCAIAAVALGWQVLQRSRSARLVLSLVAIPLFITGLVAGGFMSAIVAVATALLWLSPSREWLAGQDAPRPAQDRPVAAPTATSTPASISPPLSTSTPARRRPDPVTSAVVITIVTAGLVFVMTLASVVLFATQPDLVLDELRRQNPDIEESGLSEATLVATSYVSGGIGMLWSLLAIALAVLTGAGRGWAARGLVICAAVCAVLCVMAALASLAALVPAIAAILTVSLLRRPESRAWFSDAGRPPPAG